MNFRPIKNSLIFTSFYFLSFYFMDIIPNFKQISMIVTLIITYKWKRICGNQNSATKDNIDYFIIYIILYYIFIIYYGFMVFGATVQKVSKW